ncbi:putative transporter svop-1 [Convolutriloba macropyga]|uniref:putative transporter svop-1 n=1 Tax=Convolutriloba macropyga TaxID=536237 RepID=UPI003F51B6E7
MASPESETVVPTENSMKDPLVVKDEKNSEQDDSSHDKNSQMEIDEALSKTGFNITHILIICAISLTAFSVHGQIEVVNLLGAELYCDFELTSVEEALLTSALFTGMAVGAQVSGPIADKHGRKRVIQACSLLSALFVVASAFAQSVIQIYVIRLLIGLSMGGFHVAYTYATEVVGPEYRSKSCMIIFLLHYVGVTYAAVTGLVLVPNEDYGWRIYVLYSALPIGRSFLQTTIWALNLLCSRPNLA